MAASWSSYDDRFMRESCMSIVQRTTVSNALPQHGEVSHSTPITGEGIFSMTLNEALSTEVQHLRLAAAQLDDSALSKQMNQAAFIRT
ncbi:hypothetical protein KSP40_PGU006939 [Platanthera guangdongensis]|uniref:Uncharacterized protein n=1 Tax=Platanthera guangdongensis TaxID=2320717 RepID=A0ABR2MHB1_9ASPA